LIVQGNSTLAPRRRAQHPGVTTILVAAVLAACLVIASVLHDDKPLLQDLGGVGSLSAMQVDTSLGAAQAPSNWERWEEQSGSVVHYRHARLSFAAALRRLAESGDNHGSEGAALRDELTAHIAGAPFEAVFWECVPVTGATAESVPFEFVVVAAAPLARVTVGEPGSFSEHFAEAERAADGSVALVGEYFI